MMIAGKEVNAMLLMSYNQTIRNIEMVGRLGKIELIEVLDKKRREIHDAILEAVGEKRGSDFENALFKYREKIYRDIRGVGEGGR